LLRTCSVSDYAVGAAAGLLAVIAAHVGIPAVVIG
jgi:hypothetical protein